MADCAMFDLVCKGGDKVGDAVNGEMQEFAKSMSDLATSIMKWLNSWWMSAPAPDLEADPIMRITTDLQWYTAAFAIIGFFFALGRMVLSQDFKSLIGGVQPIVNMIMVVACYATGITLAITAGDEFSTWIMDRVSMESQGGTDISVLVALGPTLGVGGWIMFGMLAILASAMNFVFMLFRNVLLTIMIAILPTVAASTGTEAGKQAFAKANGYLLAFILFKPVAAIIYALGLWFSATPLGEDSKGNGAGDMGEAAVAAMMGMAIIVLAALALPALIKFLIPVAAKGAGGFSGGAALGAVATVAAGAAVVASTGGAGTAAGGGGAATTAGKAATTGGGEGAATATGSAAAPPGGGSGATGSSGGSSPEGGSGPSGAGGDSSGGGSEAQAGGQPEGSSEGGSGTGGDQKTDASSNAGGANGSPSAAGSGSSSGGGTGGSTASGSGAAGSESSGSTSGAGAGSTGGSSSIGDRAAVAGLVSDGASGAGSSVEKAIEDE